MANGVSNICSSVDCTQIVFIIITTSSIVPVLPIFPSVSNISTQNIWILLFYKDGIYFQILPILKAKIVKKSSGCSCGRTSKGRAQSCADSFAYKSRCPCLKQQNRCHVSCNCVFSIPRFRK